MERIAISRVDMGDQERKAVADVLSSGRLAQGPRVAEFEEHFAKVAGCDHGVAVSNGTVALELALEALGLARGEGVHTTPFTFIATGASIAANGLVPSFSDISLASYNLDDDHVEAALVPSTRALMPVHLYGLPSPMDGLLDIAKRRKLRVIEDAAQAVGATYKAKPVGSLGDAACFSLYATKNVTTGEGGMVTTNDAKIAEHIRLARNQGQRSRYEYARLGGNYRLTEMQAAIGVVQLKRLASLNEKRRENAAQLNKGLADVPELVLPMEPPGMCHVWHQYTLRARNGNRDALKAHLDRAGIEAGVYYPQGLHQTGLFPMAVHGPLKRCEVAAGEVLSLPVHPGVGAPQRKRIIEAVRSFFA